MHTFAAAGAGFLLAVLLVRPDVRRADVQARSKRVAAGRAGVDLGLLPPVTTEAYPMNRLVAV